MGTEQKTKIEIERILLVEDQIDPLRLLERVVNETLPKYSPNFRGYEIARAYNTAKELIEKNKYELILLDHRMPRIYVTPSDIVLKFERGEKLTPEEMSRYFTEEEKMSDQMENIGYSLIPEIRRINPNTIVVGTSSMKREFGDFPSPDFSLSKLNAKEDLEKILSEIILKGGETK
jgi:CheY-like chemotaxis protein